MWPFPWDVQRFPLHTTNCQNSGRGDQAKEFTYSFFSPSFVLGQSSSSNCLKKPSHSMDLHFPNVDKASEDPLCASPTFSLFHKNGIIPGLNLVLFKLIYPLEAPITVKDLLDLRLFKFTISVYPFVQRLHNANRYTGSRAEK